jgi:hypothetical protein
MTDIVRPAPDGAAEWKSDEEKPKTGEVEGDGSDDVIYPEEAASQAITWQQKRDDVLGAGLETLGKLDISNLKEMFDKLYAFIDEQGSWSDDKKSAERSTIAAQEQRVMRSCAKDLGSENLFDIRFGELKGRKAELYKWWSSRRSFGNPTGDSVGINY